MIKVFILSIQMGGGFVMMPMADEAACRTAVADMVVTVAFVATCYQIEQIKPGSKYAPETAPLPPPKPGERA